MKTRTKTIRGWANNSDLMFSENSNNRKFLENLEKYKQKHLQGFTQLSVHQTLVGKDAKEKVIIKGWYWRGSWADAQKRTYAIFYK